MYLQTVDEVLEKCPDLAKKLSLTEKKSLEWAEGKLKEWKLLKSDNDLFSGDWQWRRVSYMIYSNGYMFHYYTTDEYSVSKADIKDIEEQIKDRLKNDIKVPMPFIEAYFDLKDK